MDYTEEALENALWKVIDSYFDKPGEVLAENQIKSYNDLVKNIIPQYVIGLGDVVCKDPTTGEKLEVHFTACQVSKPVQSSIQQTKKLTPHTARTFNYNYLAQLYVNLSITYNGQVVNNDKVRLCYLPVMVKSCLCHLSDKTTEQLVKMNECPFDIGGYFIINGNEKIIIPQERPVQNAICCFIGDTKTKALARVEVKSTIDQRFYPLKMSKVVLTTGFQLHLYLPYGRKAMPICIIFKALGVTRDDDIAKMLGYGQCNCELTDSIIVNCLTETKHVVTQMDAISLLSVNLNMPQFIEQAEEEELDAKIKYIYDILNREFLPHTGNNTTKKLMFFVRMCKELIECYKNPELATDRDSLLSKRLDTAGPLLFRIFSSSFNNLQKTIRSTLYDRIKSDDTSSPIFLNNMSEVVQDIVRKSNLEVKMINSIANGNWSTSRQQANDESKKGISQQRSTLSYLSLVSHCRRVNSPISSAGSKCKPPRKLHGTQTPKLCPDETPEGHQVGIVKNLSLLCSVTLSSHPEPFLYSLKALSMIQIENVTPEEFHSCSHVIVNGDLVGVFPADKLPTVVEVMRYFKLTGMLNPQSSITWDHDQNTLYVFSDAGRYIVPYYRVNNDNRLLFEQLLGPDDDEEGGEGLSLEFSRLTKQQQKEFDLSSVMDMNALLQTNKLSKQAPIEWLDPHQDSVSLIAMSHKELWNYESFTVNDSTSLVGHLNNSVELSGLNKNSLLASIKLDVVKEAVEPWIKNVHVVNKRTRLVVLELTSDIETISSQFCVLLKNLNRFVTDNFVQYTHCMLHPSMIKGAVSTMIPFADHNPSPRNCYQSSMGKQAIGIPFTNSDHRFDTTALSICYAQKPMVQTRTAKYTNMKYLHHGFLTMHCIACATGHNQEDSLILSKGAVQNGAFAINYSRTYIAKTRQQSGFGTGSSSITATSRSPDGTEFIEMAPKSIGVGMKISKTRLPDGKLYDRYHSINTSTTPHLPRIGSFLEGNDVVIPKMKVIVSTANGKTERLLRDTSICVKSSEKGIVSNVVVGKDEKGHNIVKVRVDHMRELTTGDKLASMAAQKGVVGCLYNRADMMFSSLGITPDTIMNPHAIPSRMTNGQFFESLMAKLSLATGQFFDCTAFCDVDLQQAQEQLCELGYDPYGDELMYNGFTGRISGICYMAPTYYQRLKHMVSDKMHARARGPIQNLTKQPTEGRSRDGGIRVGEMERDACIAHGISHFLKEKLCDDSDITDTIVSRVDGSFLSSNPQQGIYRQGQEDVYEKGVGRIEVPYSMLLLEKELFQSGISMKPVLDDKDVV